MTLETWRRAHVESKRRPILQSTSRVQVPATFMQERQVLMDGLRPGLFDRPAALWSEVWDGPVNVAALEQAFNQMVRRHATLRTTFERIGGTLVQIVQPYSYFEVPLVDLTGPQKHMVLEQFCEDYASRIPIDIERGPLIRPFVARLSDSRYRIAASVHRIVSVPNNWHEVFVPELRILYKSFASGNPSPLKPLSIQYVDFAMWEHMYPQDEDGMRHLAHFERHFAEFRARSEATGLPNDIVPSSFGSEQFKKLANRLDMEALFDVGRMLGATRFMVMMAVFKALLYKYVGSEVITVFHDVGNRLRSEVKALVGDVYHNLPFRTTLEAEMSFKDLIQHVRTTVLDVFEHQEVPFEQISLRFRPNGMLAFPDYGEFHFTVRRFTNKLAPKEQQSRKDNVFVGSDLMVAFGPTSSGLEVTTSYRPNRFGHDTVSTFLADMQNLIKNIVANPESRLLTLLG